MFENWILPKGVVFSWMNLGANLPPRKCQVKAVYMFPTTHTFPNVIFKDFDIFFLHFSKHLLICFIIPSYVLVLYNDYKLNCLSRLPVCIFYIIKWWQTHFFRFNVYKWCNHCPTHLNFITWCLNFYAIYIILMF